ncbi:MAG TPA: hypothetical protein VGM19_04315 [Armatimonadota bacterium]|jgi:hypothetical protein
MRKRLWLFAVIVVLLAGGGYFLYQRTRPVLSDQQQIKNVILTAAHAVEQHKTKTVMDQVADDYSDGTYDRQSLETVVRGALAYAGESHISTFIRSLEVQGDRATAQVSVEMTTARPQVDAGGLPTSNQGSYEVQVEFRKTDRGWKVTSTKGLEAAGGGL